jgi:hypothetical protein
MGIDGNETADQLTRQGSSNPLRGPETVLGISAKVARGKIGGLTSRKHKEYWQTAHAWHQTKGLLKRPSAKRAGELFDLGRNWRLIMMGVLTRHWHVNGCLFNLGLLGSPGETDRQTQTGI